MHYREAIVWQKAMEAAKCVYRLAPKLPREEIYGMRSQITRAAVSIPANIAEGWARESQKEKAQLLAIAQGSLAETKLGFPSANNWNGFQNRRRSACGVCWMR